MTKDYNTTTKDYIVTLLLEANIFINIPKKEVCTRDKFRNAIERLKDELIKNETSVISKVDNPRNVSDLYINFEYYISTTYASHYRNAEKIKENFKEIKDNYPILPENPDK